MEYVSPLPQVLVDRYRRWKAGPFIERQIEHEMLASQGQKPEALVISCCDSRVHATSIFGSETGEFFIHRNIANMVPPFTVDEVHHGTSAVIEFAVMTLEINHIIVLGHSQCGGVRHCHDTCTGEKPVAGYSFVDDWMEILRPGYERVRHITDKAERIRALEHAGVVLALENLMGFPFVEHSVNNGALQLHGLWHSIGDGVLEMYDRKTHGFVSLA